MKKIVLLTGIIISTILVSCSTDDTQVDYNQKSSKTNFTRETPYDFSMTCRDSVYRENDTLESEPIKPRRD